MQRSAGSALQEASHLLSFLPAGASGGALKELLGWTWNPIPSAGADVDGPNVKVRGCPWPAQALLAHTSPLLRAQASASHNSAALLSVGISSGQLAWDMTLEEETASQCTCVGVALEDCDNAAYQNDKAWMYRCYNGYLYILGREDKNGGPVAEHKIMKGDTMAFVLDMDAGTLSLSIADRVSAG